MRVPLFLIFLLLTTTLVDSVSNYSVRFSTGLGGAKVFNDSRYTLKLTFSEPVIGDSNNSQYSLSFKPSVLNQAAENTEQINMHPGWNLISIPLVL